MMDEAKIKEIIGNLEKQRDELSSRLNATLGALQAYQSVIDPSILKQMEQQAPPAPPQQ